MRVKIWFWKGYTGIWKKKNWKHVDAWGAERHESFNFEAPSLDVISPFQYVPSSGFTLLYVYLAVSVKYIVDNIYYFRKIIAYSIYP